MRMLTTILLICAILMVACSPNSRDYYANNNSKKMQKANQKHLWQGKKHKPKSR